MHSKNLSTKAVLSFALALVLAAFAVAQISGCSFLSKTEAALTGQNAVVTCKIVGLTVQTIMRDAAKAYVAKEITAAQWQTLADLNDNKFQPAYTLEVKNIAAEENPASTALVSIMEQIVSTYHSYAK